MKPVQAKGRNSFSSATIKHRVSFRKTVEFINIPYIVFLFGVSFLSLKGHKSVNAPKQGR